jgi:type I restriction enzyme S subunit
MITDLRPYPAYKDSGIPWLGVVPMHWNVWRLKQICRLAYGDSLPTGVREKGIVPVFGSNGSVGFHSSSNTNAPCIVIGRKGSFGKVNFSSVPVFAIDTTFFIDSRFTNAGVRWLFYLLIPFTI